MNPAVGVAAREGSGRTEWKNAAQTDSRDHSRHGDGIGNDEEVVINEGRGDQKGHQDRMIRQRQERPADLETVAAAWPEHDVHVIGGQEEQPDEELDQRVAHRDRRTTGAAFAPQGQPAQDRNVIARGDGIPALRAPRARPDHALFPGDPVDANIEKTANDGPHDKDTGAQHDQPRTHRHHNVSSSRLGDEIQGFQRASTCSATSPGVLPSVSIAASAAAS